MYWWKKGGLESPPDFPALFPEEVRLSCSVSALHLFETFAGFVSAERPLFAGRQ